MCGIAGIISGNPQLVSQDRLKIMSDALAHRGPDGEGFYIDLETPGHFAGLAHRRLAILDLTEAAAQPLQYGKRFWIVHNGEIYNYKELADYLGHKGFSFTTHTDTEVILAAYLHFREKCLQHFDGMFSFAIWDEAEKELFCARDRFGEKPFFYHYDEASNQFLFASEMKALWAAGVPREPNYHLFYQYLTLGSTSEVHFPERSFFQHIFNLPPGQFLRYKVGKDGPVTESYWDIDKESIIEISDVDAVERFGELFQISVHRRQRSDVPIGTSLSGGLDSSSIAVSCHRFPARQYSHYSFSAVFPGFEKDESEYIRQVNKMAGLSAHWVTPTVDELVKDIETLCFHQEEPFNSTSVYAQYRVYRLAKEHQIKVLLDGQGADEVLAGYTRYIHWYLQELIGEYRFSEAQREFDALRKNHIDFRWGPLNYLAAFFPALASSQLERKAYRTQMNNRDIEPDFRESYFQKGSVYKPIADNLNDILYYDTMIGGLRELLRYADRNSMAHGCEVRLPFLFHELVQFAFSLPAHYKIREGFSKWILRKSIDGSLPAGLVQRTDKIGFEPPQKTWMQDPRLQALMQEGRRRLADRGILKKEAVTKKIQPQAAYAAENYDWRYWLAAMILDMN